ncbi:MAG: hypothetical protein M5U28_51150 [Sandaracinaceae bacterium]|nr:hypothetical protein [Sandaracinaceae bacterium]
MVERAAILIDDEVVTRAALEPLIGMVSEPPPASGVHVVRPFEPRPLDAVAREAAEEAERRHIEATLAFTGGNKSRAAALLGVSRSTLWKKLRREG